MEEGRRAREVDLREVGRTSGDMVFRWEHDGGPTDKARRLTDNIAQSLSALPSAFE